MCIIFVDKINFLLRYKGLLIRGTRPQKKGLMAHAVHLQFTLSYPWFYLFLQCEKIMQSMVLNLQDITSSCNTSVLVTRNFERLQPPPCFGLCVCVCMC